MFYKYLKNKLIKNILIKTIYLVFLLFVNISFSFSENTGNTQKQVVKVGFFYLKGFQEYDSIGQKTGYNIEYLYQIKLHTGWTFEFVKFDSFEDAKLGLDKSEIDILAPCQSSPERLAQYELSKPIGVEYGSILTLKDRNDLIYEDYANFNTITIGCVRNSIFEKPFLQYCKKNNFQPAIKYYRDNQSLLSALAKKEIDAVVINLMTYTDSLKILAKLEQKQIHYLLKKNSPLTTDLNNSIDSIHYENYNYENNLEAKWFPSYGIQPFTKQELSFINKLTPLSIAYGKDNYPLSYMDEETGKPTGIFKEIFSLISKQTGINFSYIFYTNSTLEDVIKNKKNINLISGVEYNTVHSNINAFFLTTPYFTSQKVFIQKSNTDFSKTPNLRYAFAKNSETFSKFFSSNNQNSFLQIYNNSEAALTAIKDDQADIAILNQYLAEAVLRKPFFNSLKIYTQKNFDDLFCLGILSLPEPFRHDGEKHKMILSILNKAIASLDKDEINRITIAYTSGKPYKITLKDFYYKYQPTVIITILLFLLVLVFTIFFSEQNHKINKIIWQNEKQLKNITSNINGGIAILNTKQSLKITYANEGFLEMLQYNASDLDNVIDQSFSKFVQTNDAFLLEQFQDLDKNKQNKISLQIRLIRKDLSTLPVLFTGTFIINQKKQQELYCVIIDNSRQIFMLEKLEMEQKRYNVLLEKSQDIIFDINVLTEDISVSGSLERKFGWTLPKKTCSADLASFWHLNPDDELKFQKAVFDIMNNVEDISCIVRLIKNTGIQLWCNIFFHAILQNGKRVRIIGKIEDIDAEIREKQIMLFKANTDSLTGLYRKESFYTLCKEYIAKNPKVTSALVFIDMDNFKTLNDSLGHIKGDEAICDTARKLQIIFSHYDIISRFGGDEFCVFVKDIPVDTLTFKLGWILEKMKTDYTVADKSVTITASIGIALFPKDGNNFEQILDSADKALYQAKAHGKNCFAFFS